MSLVIRMRLLCSSELWLPLTETKRHVVGPEDLCVLHHEFHGWMGWIDDVHHVVDVATHSPQLTREGRPQQVVEARLPPRVRFVFFQVVQPLLKAYVCVYELKRKKRV